MSTALHLSAPASSSCPAGYCDKHPHARVIGVCSACLANKLSSLTHTSTAFAPENSNNFCACSPLSNSPPGSANSRCRPDRDHLQTIDEEADSSAREIKNEGLFCSALEATLTPVEVCAVAELIVGNNAVHSSVNYDVVHPIKEEQTSINQGISLTSDVVSSINEEVTRPINLEEGKPKANPYLRANKPIKCKRSKSLCAVRGDSLIKLEQEAHVYESAATIEGEQSNTGTKKVTLRTLFQLDDEEKWRDRALFAPHASESGLGMHRFSADHKPIEKGVGRSSICETQQIEQTKDVHDHHTHSQRCVPSASTLSSSVCPSMPSKLKHSVLLNSLLCRKTGQDKKGSGSIRKPSHMNDGGRTIFIRTFSEGGLTQASDHGAFIRATYIASESREALQRSRSKYERSVARSSVSSSQPASPPSVSHSVDMKSERKFNLTARALAAEFPSILHSSVEPGKAMVMIPSMTEDSYFDATHAEDCEEAQDLRSGDSIAITGGIPTRLQSSTVEVKPAILLFSRPREEHHLGHMISKGAEDGEVRRVTESGPFTGINREAQDDDEEREHLEMPRCRANVDFWSRSQPQAADQTTGMIPFITRASLEEEAVHEGSSLADAAQESPNGIPTYITATGGSQEESMAVACSCSSSSGKTIAAAGQQGTHKVPEDSKKGGVWDAYSNNSGRGVRKWPASSRTGKIAPAQSGLLRFYLTPLGASGRTRFTSTRRPPKRHFWSLIFI